MNVSVGGRWESFIEAAIKAGRYGSASEVVREGLRLVEEREAKLNALKVAINDSIAVGGEVSEGDLDEALAAASSQLRQEGKAE